MWQPWMVTIVPVGNTHFGNMGMPRSEINICLQEHNLNRTKNTMLGIDHIAPRTPKNAGHIIVDTMPNGASYMDLNQKQSLSAAIHKRLALDGCLPTLLKEAN